MWLVFAALTVLSWGSSDVFFKKSMRGIEHNEIKLLVYNGITLAIFGFAYMVFERKSILYIFDCMYRYFPIAILYILSMPAYYKALEMIKISIASPIANSSCLLTFLLCIFFLGQYVTYLQLTAIILIISSMIFLSINDKSEDDVEKERVKNKKPLLIYIIGILFALAYFALDGVASFLDEYVLEYNMEESEIIIAFSFIYFIIGVMAYFYGKIKFKDFKIELDKYKAIGTIFETLGEYTYVYALASGNASIISPFIASYSAVSIILSRIFLREKLRLQQYIFVSLIMVGIVILSLG
jgi:uncharacterized membrane protein